MSRPVEVQAQFASVPSSAAAARRSLDVFSDWLPSHAFADLRVVITELVTNCVKYGPGQLIDVRVALQAGGHVRGEVDDGGSGGVRMRMPGPVGGGLGLVIVDALVDSWGVRPNSSHVWFELAAPVG
jgi:two-component sensor histidine kinase